MVGVLEEIDSTLRVMQAVLPRFFRGIHDKFGGENGKNCIGIMLIIVAFVN